MQRCSLRSRPIRRRPTEESPRADFPENSLNPPWGLFAAPAGAGSRPQPDGCNVAERGVNCDRSQAWRQFLGQNFLLKKARFAYADIDCEIEAGTETALAFACSFPISPATRRPMSSGVVPTAFMASGIAAAMRAAAAATVGDVTVMDRDDKLSAASATRTPASVCAA